MHTLAATIAVCLITLTASGREWTDSTGAYKVRAEMVGFRDGKVILQREGGGQVAVPLSRLSEDDRAYVKRRLKASPPPAATRPASPRATPEDKQRAEQLYEKIVRAYLHGKWAELAEALKAVTRERALLSEQRREDLAYVRQASAKCRPAWWQACKSTTATTFRPTVWNRAVPALYEPGDKAGFRLQLNGPRVLVTLSWNPGDVDGDAPASDKALARHGCTMGDETELGIWRMLTKNRLLAPMPATALREVFSAQNPNRLAFEHFQEFRAKLEILKNGSPGARRMEMVIILAGFTNKESDNPDARTRRALGHMFLAEVLADPSKWPSVRLPGKMPQNDLLRSLAMSIKTKINSTNTWTLAEDKALREAAGRFCKANGQGVLRTGKVVLPNGKTFMLMPQGDGPFRDQRIAWLKEQLQKTIDGG